jgi:prevent-host-death family protein
VAQLGYLEPDAPGGRYFRAGAIGDPTLLKTNWRCGRLLVQNRDFWCKADQTITSTKHNVCTHEILRTAQSAGIERCVMRANNRISLETLRRSLGRVAQDVERGGSVVVERRGEEVFALVPMRLYRFLEEPARAPPKAARAV